MVWHDEQKSLNVEHWANPEIEFNSRYKKKKCKLSKPDPRNSARELVIYPKNPTPGQPQILYQHCYLEAGWALTIRFLFGGAAILERLI